MSERAFPLWVALNLSLLFVPPLSAQDFEKSYNLGTEGAIIVHNVSGNINVVGYDGTTVHVRAFKEGRDRDQVEVEDRSTASQVELRARYPHNGNCNASVRFKIEVPRSTRFKLDPLTTASGDISVSSVAGKLKAESASGNIDVRTFAGFVHASTASGNVRLKAISGQVNARSVSGNVDAEITRMEGSEPAEFSTVSGDTTVTLPDNADAELNMSTVSGSVETEFPVVMQGRQHGPGNQIRARIGNGTRSLKITSVSGNVRVSRSH